MNHHCVLDRFRRTIFRLVLAAGGILAAMTGSASAGTADYVIEISVDGLGSPYLQSLVSGNQLPNFSRLQSEGAWTLNARNDYDYTVTLPNHVSIVTGRGVTGDAGHGWTGNVDPPAGATLASNKGSYVASVFDVAHDNGLRTGLYAGKSKFSLLDTSYNSTNGAPDVTGVDNGRGKIDSYIYNSDPGALVNSYISAMSSNPMNYSLLHLGNPDFAGSWGSTTYNNAVKTVDGYLGSILSLVESNPALKGKTTLIVTADHGGAGNSHSTATAGSNYTIPLLVWGAGVTAGVDLYSLNTATRTDPGTGRPSYSAPAPIRNSDGANLALGLLGLGPIPGSTINVAQNLAIQGVGVAPRQVIAYTAFNETSIGVNAWTPGAGNTELGFSTLALSGTMSPAPYLGTYDSTSSPRRFRMLGYEAQTTFAAIDLTNYQDVKASIDILIKNTTYEADDYYRAILTDGIHTIILAEVLGTNLNALAKDVFLTYTAEIPSDWKQVTLKISSHTNSGASAEAVDFDNIFFTATPEPASLLILMAGGGLLLRSRRRFTAQAFGRR